MEKLAPATPGELLLEEFLIPMGISRYRLAREIGVAPQRIGDIVAGNALSLRILTFACAVSSNLPTATGSVRRSPMTRKSRK